MKELRFIEEYNPDVDYIDFDRPKFSSNSRFWVAFDYKTKSICLIDSLEKKAIDTIQTKGDRNDVRYACSSSGRYIAYTDNVSKSNVSAFLKDRKTDNTYTLYKGNEDSPWSMEFSEDERFLLVYILAHKDLVLPKSLFFNILDYKKPK